MILWSSDVWLYCTKIAHSLPPKGAVTNSRLPTSRTEKKMGRILPSRLGRGQTYLTLSLSLYLNPWERGKLLEHLCFGYWRRILYCQHWIVRASGRGPTEPSRKNKLAFTSLFIILTCHHPYLINQAVIMSLTVPSMILAIYLPQWSQGLQVHFHPCHQASSPRAHI